MTPRAPPRPRPNKGQSHHDDFIRRFTQRESQNRIAKRPKPLSAAQHAALREQLKEVHFLQPDYADATKLNVAGILRKWKKYCESVLSRSWKEMIGKADRATVMDFLFHLCESYKIKSWGTSWEYLRQFKQLYASTTGRFMDRNDSREILKWHDTVLVSRFRLQAPNNGGKDVADSGDLLAITTFNIAHDTAVFPLERHRIQLAGCYLTLAYTGARPAEVVENEKKRPKDGSWEELFGPKAIGTLLDDNDADKDATDENSQLLEELLSEETTGRGRPKALCYEDILLMIVRHPQTGQDVLAMSIKFIHHKGADNKPKPTIFFFTITRRLIFCLITVIVSIAVHDEAFDAPNLTSAKGVFEKKHWGPGKCTPLRWKKEWLKKPVFRRFHNSVTSDEPLQYHKLRDDMARQSLDYGCEKAIEPKAWRRGAANKANGNAPDAVRDQMMRHDPKWATFNSAYINEKVQFHLQNAFLDEPTDDSLIGMLTHIGLMCDPRASKDMVPDEIWEDLPPDPEILELEAQRHRLKGGQYRICGTENEEEIRTLTKEIRAKRAQRDKTIRQQYREYYFYNRPTWDIERQAQGEEEEAYIEPAIDLRIPERAQLAKILCNQPEDLSYKELFDLRIQAAELMVALCDKREMARCKRIRPRAGVETWVKDCSGPDPFPLIMQKTQCPRCIGDERLTYEERTFPYCRTAVMNDHFDREHLNEMKSYEGQNLIFCDHPKCKEEGVKLKHLDHFRAHVMSVHGVSLRPSDRVKSFAKTSHR